MAEGSLFDKYDVDGDGRISREEALEVVKQFMSEAGDEVAREEILDRHFQKADVNDDGMLGREEFDQFVALISGLACVRSAIGTGPADLDSPRPPAPSRSKSSLTWTPAPAPDLEEDMTWADYMKKYDVNHDNKLNVSEAIALLKGEVSTLKMNTDFLTDEWMTSVFKSVDTDGDVSTISQDEYTLFLERVMEDLAALGPASVPDDEAEIGARVIESEGSGQAPRLSSMASVKSMAAVMAGAVGELADAPQHAKQHANKACCVVM